MTELAYPVDSDSAYVREFRATVVVLPPGAVVLDRTYFYPGGGGQPPDRGALTSPGGESIPIADVSRAGPEVLHRIGRSKGAGARALRPGDAIAATIDWERRFAHMRLHTAQHLASAVLFRECHLRTRRAVLGGRVATIELEAPAPSGSLAEAWRLRFDRAVAEGRPVRVRHVPRDAYERNPSPRSGLVPLPMGITEVRLIDIEGQDASPCGGTHLRDTREIGPVRFEPIAPEAPERVRFTLEEPGESPDAPSA